MQIRQFIHRHVGILHHLQILPLCVDVRNAKRQVLIPALLRCKGVNI